MSSVADLRHRLTRAPARALALAWLLATVFVLGSLPGVTVHAHGDAPAGHHHHDGGHPAHPHHGDEGDGRAGDDATVPGSPASLHVHDTSLVFAPASSPVLVPASARPLAPPAFLPASPGGLPVAPLHRPPIA